MLSLEHTKRISFLCTPFLRAELFQTIYNEHSARLAVLRLIISKLLLGENLAYVLRLAPNYKRSLDAIAPLCFLCSRPDFNA
jgi:hypothetical protein